MSEIPGSTTRRQRGFTLIELVIVIAIVAVLAAVALPRFIRVQVDARVAKAQAIYGATKTAAALARARCELDLVSPGAGLCTAAAGTVDMDGTAVAMLNMYPVATAAGIDAAAQLSVTEGLTIAGAAPRTFDIVGATTPANCRISYTAAAAVGAAPVITLVTTGC